MSARRYVIHDSETTGLNYDYDQVLECALLTLDENLDIVPDSELVLSVRPRVDVPPHPEACLTHKLNLADLRRRGMSEYEFAREFLAYVGKPNTFIGGYNNIQYDDEIMRRVLFRNLRDPYGHEWRDGSRRFDVLNLVRTLYAWDPELTLRWPTNEAGEVSMKLSTLAPANNIELNNAHNAMADVRATAELLQLIKALGTPWLDRCFELTDKSRVERMMSKRTPLFHVSPFYSKDRCYSSLILPVIRDAAASNKVLCVDLAEDPTDLLAMTPDEIRRYRFTPRNELEENPPSAPVTSVQINKQPSLAEIKEVPPSLHGRMKIDLKECMEHAKMIAADRGFAERLQQAYKLDLPAPSDVYGTLYSGAFFSRHDTGRRDQAHHLTSNRQPNISVVPASQLMRNVEDSRLRELAVRVQGLNFPGALTDPEDHRQFVDYLKKRLNDPEAPGLTVADARDAMNLCRLDRVLSEEDEAVLKDLEAHLEWIEEEAKRLLTLPMQLVLPEAVTGTPEPTAPKKPENRSLPLGFPTSLVRSKSASAQSKTSTPAETKKKTASVASKPVDNIPF